MPYTETEPHPALSPYIARYWSWQYGEAAPVPQAIYPDGCADLIINAGDDLRSSQCSALHVRQSYLVGTLRTTLHVYPTSDTYLRGIRFKPLGLYALLNVSLRGLADRTIPFSLPTRIVDKVCSEEKVSRLDAFFLSLVKPSSSSLSTIVETIYHHGGNITISALADAHCTTPRRIERIFRQGVGVPPKEICNQIRFQGVLARLTDTPRSSLAQLAYDHGFYDHAHLTNEVKKYTGRPPSQL